MVVSRVDAASGSKGAGGAGGSGTDVYPDAENERKLRLLSRLDEAALAAGDSARKRRSSAAKASAASNVAVAAAVLRSLDFSIDELDLQLRHTGEQPATCSVALRGLEGSSVPISGDRHKGLALRLLKVRRLPSRAVGCCS